MTDRPPTDDPTVPDAPEESSSAQAAVTKPPPVGAWGQTLVLGAAVPPAADTQHPAPAMRGVFAAPGIAGSTPSTSPAAVQRTAQPAATGNTHAPAPPPPALEPLRVPSNRPPPTPWQEARGARTGTMMMPGSGPKPSEAPAKPSTPAAATPSHPVATRQPAGPSQTITIGGVVPAYAPAPAPQRPASEPASPAPVQHVTTARPVPPQVPTVPPKPPQVSASPPAPKAAAPAAAPKPASISEPLQLQLADRDLLPEQAGSSRPAVPLNRSPMVGAGIAVAVLVAAFLVWLATRSDSPTAPPLQLESAIAAPGAVSPQPPTGTPQAELPAPAEAPAAARPPTKATGTLPTEAVAPTDPPAEPKPKTVEPPPGRRAAHVAKPSEPKARPASARPPARARSTPSAAVDPDIERARAALRALQGQPVLKIKPSADDGPVLKLTPERSDDNAPPEPPPAPGE